MLGTQRVRHLFSWRVRRGKAVAVETGEAKDTESPWWAVRVSGEETGSWGLSPHGRERSRGPGTNTSRGFGCGHISEGSPLAWSVAFMLHSVHSLSSSSWHPPPFSSPSYRARARVWSKICAQVFRSGSGLSEWTSHTGPAHGISSTANTPAPGGPSAPISVLSSCLCGPGPGQGRRLGDVTILPPTGDCWRDGDVVQCFQKELQLELLLLLEMLATSSPLDKPEKETDGQERQT